MAQYHRLSLVEREELRRMLAAGASLRAIGQALSRAPSTLSRELTRHQASPVTYPRRARTPTRPALGPPATQASDARGPAPLAHRRLPPARPALVTRTDCTRVAAAVSSRPGHADLA